MTNNLLISLLINFSNVGGKPRKEVKKKDEDDDDKGNPRGTTKKECVVGMIERNGKVKASNVSKGSLKAKDLKELVRTISTQQTQP